MINKYVDDGKPFDWGNYVLSQTIRQSAIRSNVTNPKHDPLLKVSVKPFQRLARVKGTESLVAVRRQRNLKKKFLLFLPQLQIHQKAFAKVYYPYYLP